MTLKNNRAPLLCYFKLFTSFSSHGWIQAGVTVRKRPIWVKIDDFFSRMTLQFDVWPWKTTGHLFYVTSSFVHNFVAIGDFKLELQSGNAQFGSNSKIWRMTLKNNRAPLQCYFKLCASFCSHWWIQDWSYSPETPNLGQIQRFLEPCDLEIWRMTLKNNRAPLLRYFKLCASFRSHLCIQTGVTVRKRPILVKFNDF